MSLLEDSEFSRASTVCSVDAGEDPFGLKKAGRVLLLTLLPLLEVFVGAADTKKGEEEDAPSTKYPNASGLSFMKEEIECVKGTYSACT